MGWQIVAAVDGVATTALEVPVAELSQLDVTHPLGVVVAYESLLAALQIHRVDAVGVGSTLAGVGEQRLLVGQRETAHVAFRQLELCPAAGLQVHFEDALQVAVLA